MQKGERADVAPVLGAALQVRLPRVDLRPSRRFEPLGAGAQLLLQLPGVEPLGVSGQFQGVDVLVLGQLLDRRGDRRPLLLDRHRRGARLAREVVAQESDEIARDDGGLQMLDDLRGQQVRRVEPLLRDDALATRHHPLAKALLAGELRVGLAALGREVVGGHPDVAPHARLARPVVLHLGDRALRVVAVRLPAPAHADQPDEHVARRDLRPAELDRARVLRAEILLPDAVEQPRLDEAGVDRRAVRVEVERRRRQKQVQNAPRHVCPPLVPPVQHTG